MKTRSKVFAPALLATGLFLTAFTFAQAQSSSTAWTTSKGVQHVANKKSFNDESLRNSHIQATSVSPTWNISKGVHRKKDDTKAVAVNVVASEDPSWIISKGVHQNKTGSVVAKRNASSKEFSAGNK
jgi:hypothetical protein